jgi:hypothetical protein
MVSLILVTKVASLQCCMIASPHWHHTEEEEQWAAGIDSECLLGCGSAHPRTFARFASHVCETSLFCDKRFFRLNQMSGCDCYEVSSPELTRPDLLQNLRWSFKTLPLHLVALDTYRYLLWKTNTFRGFNRIFRIIPLVRNLWKVCRTSAELLRKFREKSIKIEIPKTSEPYVIESIFGNKESCRDNWNRLPLVALRAFSNLSLVASLYLEWLIGIEVRWALKTWTRKRNWRLLLWCLAEAHQLKGDAQHHWHIYLQRWSR